MTTFHRIELAAILLKLALCLSAYGQPLQGEFAPQPPAVQVIPRQPIVYDPPPVVYQPPPVLAPIPQAGVWIPVRRPLPIANWLLGPVWYFQPTPPPQQQLPPPQNGAVRHQLPPPQYDSRQRGIQ